MTVVIYEARYVLIKAYKKDKKIIKSKAGSFTQTGLERQMIIHNGMTVNTLVRRVGEYNCYYVDLKYADSATKNITQQIGATLCGNMRHIMSDDGTTVYELLDQDKKIQSRYENAKKLKYKYNLKNKKIQKISQQHHLHVRLRDLYGNNDIVITEGHEAALCLYLDRYTDNEVSHITFLTYLRALPDNEKRLFIKMLLSYEGIESEWLKTEGTLAKQMQGQSSFDLSKIFELNVLNNRIETDVDWAKEKLNRTQLNVVDISDEDVYKHAFELFAIAKNEGKKPISMDWEKYWGQRATIMPGGAVHSDDKGLQALIKTLPRELKNKKGLACALPSLRQQAFTGGRPHITAYASTKYEWGKVRALYGCDYVSHVNADFGLLNCEDTFPHFIPTGPQANTQYVKNLLKSVEHDVPFCFDYDDFNSQHSKSAMIQVINAWISVYNDDISDEQKQAAVWTAQSVNDMSVMNSITDDCYEVNGTLFSGWRLTTFINTALNYVYLAKAKINKLSNMSIHNGDDVYAGMRNLKDVVSVLRNANEIGVRANNTKMSIGTIAEFLRVDMRAKNATSSQYLTRACSTFVHGRIETEAPLGYRAMVTAYKTRYDEVLERGGNMKPLKKLYRKQLFFARRLFDVSPEMAEKFLQTDVSAGGLSKNGKIGNYKFEDKPIAFENVDYGAIKHTLNNGVRDCVTSLKSYYKEIADYISFSTVQKNIMKGFNIAKMTIVEVQASSLDIHNSIALSGAWHDDQSFRVFNRVRLGVSNTIAVLGKLSNAQAEMLSKTDNPAKWLSILTK